MDIDLKKLKELMRVLGEFDIAEFEYEGKQGRVVLRKHSTRGMVVASAAPAQAVASAPTAAGAPAAAPKEDDDPNVIYVESPFVGTFYRASSPDAEAFTDVGKKIKKGQTLCIVEAMKLMNEIEAELNGTIVEILVENGKPVEYGDKLFKVRKD
ncbi:MAG: acetyl-CoA carboxylase biotin carboxyl carrier protein [Polyangiales bacterium]